MPRARLDNIRSPDFRFAATETMTRSAKPGSVREEEGRGGPGKGADGANGPRRTPRKSLIVVLPDNHVVSPEVVAGRLPPAGDHEVVEVIVACAGQPVNLAALTRRVRDVQVLLAPAGTSPADLRELAIRRAPGDIVTLLSGAVLPAPMHDSEMFQTV
jgi:hypothetical protein